MGTPPARQLVGFNSLPVELLPLVLDPLAFRGDLAAACRVSKLWDAVARPLLYRQIRMIGTDLRLVPELLTTLAAHPHLCRLIKRLEMRVFPLSMSAREREEMSQLAVCVLRQSTNIEDLIWTRKGSLNDRCVRFALDCLPNWSSSLSLRRHRVLEAIASLPALKSFELNATTTLALGGSWDPFQLLRLPRMKTLSLVLPDRGVASVLPALLERQMERPDPERDMGLEALTLLCRESTVITDGLLSSIRDTLKGSNLRHLALAGCTRITRGPLLHLLAALPSLRHLCLEACTSISPDFFSQAGPHLPGLCSLKVTHPGPRHPLLDDFYPALLDLINHTGSLHSLTLYHSGHTASPDDPGVTQWPFVTQAFMRGVAEQMGSRLRKFECSGVLMSLDGLGELVLGKSRDLKTLVIHLGWNIDLVSDFVVDLIFRHASD